MKARWKPTRMGLYLVGMLWMLVLLPLSAIAAPYAALVMDARTGEVLHETNADARLHPASLTKMMTLYIAFQAIERGEISLDTQVKISANAAAEPPSKLGLRAGQKIKLRYLIRAAAVKSANDAATAIGEAVSGSEAAFARRMTQTARAMGMTKTTFKNANGLTQEGHLSSARDMTTLGRHLLYDFPQYYNIFSRRTADAGMGRVSNTNRRLLDAYKGADGIKTGYTNAAGFNLVASAERGNERVIATVFGGRSTASRNAKVAELLDLGFRRAPSKATTDKPKPPVAMAQADVEDEGTVVVASNGAAPQAKGKTIRLQTAVKTSLRPKVRPGEEAAPPVMLAMKDDIRSALAEAVSASVAETVVVAPAPEATGKLALAAISPPTISRPEAIAEVIAETEPAAEPEEIMAEERVLAERPAVTPRARPVAQEANVVQVAAVKPAVTVRMPAAPQPAIQEVVTRVSTSGGRHWGINVGKFPNRYQAEKVLMKTALAESGTLDGSLKKVVERKGGYEASFLGMSREMADLACRRLQARKVTCFMMGPEG